MFSGPIRFVRSPERQYLVAGYTGWVNCQATGMPVPEIWWNIQGEMLQSGRWISRSGRTVTWTHKWRILIDVYKTLICISIIYSSHFQSYRGIKIPESYQYGKSYCEDKAIYNRIIPTTGLSLLARWYLCIESGLLIPSPYQPCQWCSGTSDDMVLTLFVFNRGPVRRGFKFVLKNDTSWI